jgi:transcriptional regulator with XRE-family HTH domain
MPTTEQQAIRAKRRAWLLFVARRTDPRKPKLEDVAAAIGLRPKTASSVSDWEWNVSAPKTKHLEALAVYYGIPVGVLLNPPAAILFVVMWAFGVFR